jgi:adsorption protein B
VAQWLQLLERELLFFALFWFIVGMIDEMLVDAVWIGLRCFGGVRTRFCRQHAAARRTRPSVHQRRAWRCSFPHGRNRR